MSQFKESELFTASNFILNSRLYSNLRAKFSRAWHLKIGFVLTSLLGFTQSAQSVEKCVDLFDTSVRYVHSSELNPYQMARPFVNRMTAYLELKKGTYAETHAVGLVKILETPKVTDTHVLVEFMDRSGRRDSIPTLSAAGEVTTNRIPITELSGIIATLERVDQIELTIHKSVVKPMKTRLKNIFGDEFFFFTGRVVQSQNGLIVEVMSNKRPGLFLRKASGLLPASHEDLVRHQRMQRFGLARYGWRWKSNFSNGNGLPMFKVEPVTETLIAEFNSPEMTPDSKLSELWRSTLNAYRMPVPLPENLGRGWAVYIGHKREMGGAFYQVAFFESVSEAAAFLESFPAGHMMRGESLTL